MSLTRVYIGRFQPPHIGHVEAIKWNTEKGDLIIAIGSSNQPINKDNPFTIKERTEMMEVILQEFQIDAKIVHLPDFIGDDMAWMEELLRSLSLTAKGIVVSSQNNWTLEVCKLCGIATDPQPTFAGGISATQIRDAIRRDKCWKDYLSSRIGKYLSEKKLGDGLTGVERIKQVARL